MTEAEFKKRLRRAVEKAIQREARAIARRYICMALKDPATMRHLIDRVMPPAKQEISVEHSYHTYKSRQRQQRRAVNF